MHPIFPLKNSALRCDIRRLYKLCTHNPLGNACIKTAGNRVFIATTANRRSHFKVRFETWAVGANHPNIEQSKGWPVRLYIKDLLRRTQHDCAPARAIIYPLLLNDIEWGKIKRCTDFYKSNVIKQASTYYRRGRKLKQGFSK